VSLAADAEQIYRRFVAYPLPAEMWVCEQCGPEWSAEDIRTTPLRALTLPQLVAVHVMSVDDDALRYFLPRLMDLVATQAPVFDFRLSDFKNRLPAWRPEEQAAVRGLADAVWSALLLNHPAGLGYFSDCPSALDLIDWCGLPIADHLDMLGSVDSLPAALHLADLVDAVFAGSRPFESVSRTTVVEWLRAATTGERLEQAFFAADSPEEALRLSAAHELWTVCCR
jgi:hypothetical protein